MAYRFWVCLWCFFEFDYNVAAYLRSSDQEKNELQKLTPNFECQKMSYLIQVKMKMANCASRIVLIDSFLWRNIKSKYYSKALLTIVREDYCLGL